MRKKILSLFSVLALSAIVCFGTSILLPASAGTLAGPDYGYIATAPNFAGTMKVEEKSTGSYLLSETSQGGISFYTKKGYPVYGGKAEAAFVLSMERASNADDKWLALMISDAPAVMRPEPNPNRSDMAVLVRLSGDVGAYSVSVTEGFVNNAGASITKQTDSIALGASGDMKLRIVASDKLSLYLGELLIAQTDVYDASRYAANGIYFGACAHAGSYAEGGGWKFGFAMQTPYASDASAESGAERFNVPVQLFGKEVVSVKNGSANVAFELSADGDSLALPVSSLTSYSNSLTVETAGGISPFSVRQKLAGTRALNAKTDLEISLLAPAETVSSLFSTLGAMEAGKDYTASAGKLTVSADWLSARPVSELTLFAEIGGEQVEIVVRTADTRAPMLGTVSNSTVDKKSAKDVTAKIELYSGSVSEVSVDGDKLDSSMYSYSDSAKSLTVGAGFLSRLSVGSHKVKVSTEFGNCEFSVTVKDTRGLELADSFVVFDANKSDSVSFGIETYDNGALKFLLGDRDVSEFVKVSGKTATLSKQAFAGELGGKKTLTVSGTNGSVKLEVRYTRSGEEIDSENASHTTLIVLASILPAVLAIGTCAAVFFLRKKKK